MDVEARLDLLHNTKEEKSSGISPTFDFDLTSAILVIRWERSCYDSALLSILGSRPHHRVAPERKLRIRILSIEQQSHRSTRIKEILLNRLYRSITPRLAAFALLGLVVAAHSVSASELHSDTNRVVKQTPTEVQIATDSCLLTLRPLTPVVLRVRCVKPDGHETPSLVLTEATRTPPFKVSQTADSIRLMTASMSAIFDRQTGALHFTNTAGKVFLAEIPGSRKFTPSTIQGEPTFAVEDAFASPHDESLFGSGEFQDGYLNVRDLPRRLTHVNTQIAIPFLLSSKGYGLLWHNYGLTDLNPADNRVSLIPSASGGETSVDVTTSQGTQRQTRREGVFTGKLSVPKSGRYALMLDVGQKMAKQYHIEIDGKTIIDFANLWLPPTTSWLMDLAAGDHTVRIVGDQKDSPTLFWRPSEDRTVLRSPVANALDYVVFAGPKPNDVIATYRELSGAAPIMPIWAYGYIHCRERFHSSKEILDTAAEFRKRNLPVDVMVQDWQYWGKYGWNAMQWDENFYPDPAGMIRDLHAMNAKLMVSVWSRIDPATEIGKEFVAKKFYIPDTQWVDFFNPSARDLYWKDFSQRMLSLGIDAWWQDATEPENDDLAGRQTFVGPGEKVRLLFPLYVNKTVYEGQRKDDPDKRVFILTRSAFLGQQRYASATWSGDIGNSFDTLKRQITAGLDYSATGLPYWTTDTGGFFRPGNGQYTDPTYHERFLRWLQFSTFSPLMRVHGYQTDTEPWRFGPEVEKVTRQYLDLRYQLLPYIYSSAADVTFHGASMMRPLVMDFSADTQALAQNYEFMFGSSFLVAPVLKSGAKSWPVYAPETKGGWYDFWTGKAVPSGATSTLDAPLEKLPLLVRAGSIVPFGPAEQYAGQKQPTDLEVRVYPGADGNFTLYEDEGTNYNYEHGAKSTIAFHWNDNQRRLTIARRQGDFPGMLKSRRFHITVAGSDSAHQVSYSGESLAVQM